MSYTVNQIKNILALEIKKQGAFFILEEFMDYFKQKFDNNIIKDKGNYLVNNKKMVIINDSIESENPRHFNEINKRESFGIMVTEKDLIHCFDISISGNILFSKSMKSKICIDKNNFPSSYCVLFDKNEEGIMIFENTSDEKINNNKTFHAF